MKKIQEIIAVSVQSQLREKHASGGGCIYLSLNEWADRLDISEGEVLRQVAALVDAGELQASVIEICG